MTPIEHCQFLTNKLLKDGLGEQLTPSDILVLEAVVDGLLAYLGRGYPRMAKLEAFMVKLEALIAKLPK